MNSITIADRLWFEETLLGGTLNFQTGDDAAGTLFRVGISFSSLQEINKVLSMPLSLWTIKDGSLSLYGDSEQMTLTFSGTPGSNQRCQISLCGTELKVFRYAVSAIAFHRMIRLN